MYNSLGEGCMIAQLGPTGSSLFVLLNNANLASMAVTQEVLHAAMYYTVGISSLMQYIKSKGGGTCSCPPAGSA